MVLLWERMVSRIILISMSLLTVVVELKLVNPSIQDDGEHCGEPEAINIRKIGHGKKHPLACDIQRIGEYIMKNIPDDDPDKGYRLRDVDIIYNYFCTVEDCDLYPNPHFLFMRKEEE